MNLMIRYEPGLDSGPDGTMKMSLRVLNYGLKLDNIFMSVLRSMDASFPYYHSCADK